MLSKNMPWQEGPAEFSGAPVWRYSENPIIGRNPVKEVAESSTAPLCRTATSSSEYSVVSRQTESRTSTLEEAKECDPLEFR